MFPLRVVKYMFILSELSIEIICHCMVIELSCESTENIDGVMRSYLTIPFRHIDSISLKLAKDYGKDLSMGRMFFYNPDQLSVLLFSKFLTDEFCIYAY